MSEVEMLDKTEIWVDGVTLRNVDLGMLARAAAEVLELPTDRVYVTDVRDGQVTFDVLVARLRLEQIAGREREVLTALAAVPGTEVEPDAGIHSAGVLGAIATPPETVPEVLALTDELDRNLRRWVSGRVAVVSTGAEILERVVRDTNLAAIREVLEPAGFEVIDGGAVPDVDRTIAGRVARLVSDGFGLVLTTGGVGAEDKDRTVEAVEMLDPDVATSTLAEFEVGHGRHVKGAVRVAVGQIGWGRVVCLPGPTREVRVGVPALLEGLRREVAADVLVERIGEAIRSVNRTD